MAIPTPHVCDQEARLTIVEAAVVRIEGAIVQIAEALKLLTRIDANQQQQHEAIGRAFGEVVRIEARFDRESRDLDSKVRLIEGEMPGLREMRKWVVVAVVSVLAMLGTQAFNTIRPLAPPMSTAAQK